ncbi:hypothetical protein HanOQP8_Chr16g0611551 [Helianthus annuus]|nr:hypothetical protein HanOQP8_Chr16g0611551 [Helianthus annuus]
MEVFTNNGSSKCGNKILQLVAMATLWMIWLAGNVRAFNEMKWFKLVENVK